MKKTGRGFNLYGEIEDTQGKTVRVQQSSADPLDCVHIFTENIEGASVMEFEPYRSPSAWMPAPRLDLSNPGSKGYSAVTPHLDVEGCKALIKALQAHIDYVEQSR